MVLSSEKAPVLLIRGLLRESRHWLDFPALLTEQLQRPVFMLDLPGCGVLNQQNSATSVPALRAQLQQQWAERYPEYQGKAVHLVAISMGGMLALDWALAAPQQVKSLALINSSSAGLNPFWQRLQPRNYLKVLLCLLAGPLQREELIWQMTVNSPLQPDVLKQWQQWAIENPVSRINALRQLWAASRFQVTQQPACPVLVVSGLADQLVSPRCSQALANQLNAPLLTHADAGHDLPLEAGAWLAAVIDQNLNEVYRQYNCV
ncbi:MAG: alpha/beta fold hydrolase [Gammaproteobacteria bacterium]|nr:alpha/beta fold hydrolase [Gammaproteobacteria bacterium]